MALSNARAESGALTLGEASGEDSVGIEPVRTGETSGEAGRGAVEAGDEMGLDTTAGGGSFFLVAFLVLMRRGRPEGGEGAELRRRGRRRKR